jgi:hypothetical protein
LGGPNTKVVVVVVELVLEVEVEVLLVVDALVGVVIVELLTAGGGLLVASTEAKTIIITITTTIAIVAPLLIPLRLTVRIVRTHTWYNINVTLYWFKKGALYLLVTVSKCFNPRDSSRTL